jgi:mono/diheme cytochrome c family protein
MRGRLAWCMAAAVLMFIAGCQKESPYPSSGSASGPPEGSAASSSAPPVSSGAPSVSGTAPGAAKPAEFAKGESLFKGDCGPCHGQDAMGTDLGPPLIHPIYQPDHHSDASFYLAIRNGARSHHWMYGDMPPVQGVSDDDAKRIVAYIRRLQHQAGIF